MFYLIACLLLELQLLIQNSECKLLNLNLKVNEPLNFIALGDWGGRDYPPFTTKVQISVAKQMREYAAAHNKTLAFVMALGDNFYFNGVKSPDDSRFKSTYESVYLKGPLKPLPWYVIAGNHDHRKHRIKNQLLYSKLSRNWVFPDLFYTMTIKMKLSRSKKLNKVYKLIKIFMIDTTVLCHLNDELYNSEVYDTPNNYAFDKLTEEIMMSTMKHEDDGDQQHQQLNIMVGHHPLFTNMMERTASKCLSVDLKYLMNKFNINIYISGHDHTLQYNRLPMTSMIDSSPLAHFTAQSLLNQTNSDEHPDSVKRRSLHTFVSGAGAGLYRVSSKTTNKYYDNLSDSFYWSQEKIKDGGFLVMSFYENSFNFKFFSSNGSMLYSKNKQIY